MRHSGRENSASTRAWQSSHTPGSGAAAAAPRTGRATSPPDRSPSSGGLLRRGCTSCRCAAGVTDRARTAAVNTAIARRWRTSRACDWNSICPSSSASIRICMKRWACGASQRKRRVNGRLTRYACRVSKPYRCQVSSSGDELAHQAADDRGAGEFGRAVVAGKSVPAVVHERDARMRVNAVRHIVQDRPDLDVHDAPQIDTVEWRELPASLTRLRWIDRRGAARPAARIRSVPRPGLQPPRPRSPRDRGPGCRPAGCRSRRPAAATIIAPTPVPTTAGQKVSARTCTRSRARVAPSAARIPSSRCRIGHGQGDEAEETDRGERRGQNAKAREDPHRKAPWRRLARDHVAATPRPRQSRYRRSRSRAICRTVGCNLRRGAAVRTRRSLTRMVDCRAGR